MRVSIGAIGQGLLPSFPRVKWELGLKSDGGGLGEGQVCIEDTAWNLRSSRTAAMGRSGIWIEGHLRPSASGGPTSSVTSGVGWRTQGFSLLWMRLWPLGGFSPRVRTVRLRGGVAQLSPEEDSRTSAEGGLPGRQLAMVCCSHCEPRSPGGGGEGRGAGPWPPPRRRRRRHVGAGLIGPVPGRGGGGGGGAVNNDGAPTRTPDLGSNGGDRSGGGTAPGGLGQGLQVAWATTRNRRSVNGPSGGVLTLRVPDPVHPGVAWLQPSCSGAPSSPSGGSRRTTRKQLLQLASGRVGLEPSRLIGWVELWIFTRA